MMRVGEVAAGVALLSVLSLAACGDGAGWDSFAPTPVPPDEQALRDVTFAEIVQEGFGAQELAPRGTVLEAADGSTYRHLGRLIGHLYSPSSVSMAVFIDFLPSGQDDRPEGVYVAFVSLGGGRQPQHGHPAVLTSSRGSILPVGERGDVEPFRQNGDSPGGATSISPVLVLDLEGDGLEEMALLVRTRLQGVSFEHYDVYQRDVNGSGWRRAGGQGAISAPGLGTLKYWASVGAAVHIASRWEREQRLLTVWPWLAQENAPLDPDVLLGLVPDGDPEKVDETQEALIFLRTFFDEAYQRFSEGFRGRQPWPGFINGFKSTRGVHLVSISPPVFDEDGTATVEILLDLTEREGEEPVVRRFLVETEMVQEGAEWYLSGVSAAEQREP